jgi:AcrR family transcriptional regulator
MSSRRRRSRKAGSRGVPRPVREQRILEVAGRVFAARGYHAASMEEIAGRADITKPVIYAYFGSKEGLYVAYIERSGQELLERMRSAADPGLPPADRLRAGLLEFLRFVDERREGWEVLYAEAAARGGPLANEIADFRARIAGIVRRLLEQTMGEVESSKRTAVALDGVAHAVVGAGESLANWWLGQPDVAPEDVAEWILAVSQAPSISART